MKIPAILTLVFFTILGDVQAAKLETDASPSKDAIVAESDKARQFFEDAFKEMLKRRPQFQSQLGIKDDYDKWDNITEEFERETVQLLKHRVRTLEQTIDYALLDDQNKISYELFIDDAKRRISRFEYRFHTYPVNQMRGLQSSVPAFLINIHKVTSVDDAEAYISRLEKVRPLFAHLIENLDVRTRENIIAPRFVFPHVLSDIQNVVTGAPFDSGEDCALFADFKKKVGTLGLSDDQASALIAHAEKTLIESVGPAYRELGAHVADLQEKSTTDDGVWKLPDGESFYAHRLNLMTTTGFSAKEVHEIGLREVERIHFEMRAIMEKVGFKGELSAFFEFMRTDPQFYYDESEEGRQAYLDGAVEIINSMRDRLDELFNVKPEASIVVKAVEAFREKSAGKAFYQSPAPDGSRPGTYYANLYRMSDMPTYQMEALAYHEGIPGHHMQRAISIETEGLPRFRKYASYTAYTEGWALYTEYIPKEIGFYKDPYSDFGRLAMELWRACRLVVDTGIHSMKWTREQAIDYLTDNTPNPEGDAVKAIERYIVMPGQATAYKIGMIKILELREGARERLGDRFDIRQFHDLVLQNGPVPLTMLERLVNDWVKSELSVQ